MTWLFRIHGHEQVIALPTEEKNSQLISLNLIGSFLIIVEVFYDFVVYLLNHVAPLQASCLRRAACLYRRDHDTGRLRRDIHLTHHRRIERLNAECSQYIVRRFDRLGRFLGCRLSLG